MLLPILFAISIFALALVPIVALLYSYSTRSAIESGVGFAILAAVAGVLFHYRRQANQSRLSPAIHRAILLGTVLGVLWMIEISINNFLAPPLPGRDIIDNIFWGVIALSMLSFAIIHAYQTGSIVGGIAVGAWSGFASGLLACCMGLAVVVFGMRFITKDPLNISEWAERGTSSHAPTMSAYFAFETFAGAFGHLIVLGMIMGGLLGAIGGILGKAIQKTAKRIRHE